MINALFKLKYYSLKLIVMKIKKLLVLFICTAFGLFVISCSGTKNASTATPVPGTDDKTVASSSVNPDNSSLPLSDYLKRIPGVRIIGSGASTQVSVRGGSMSTHGSNAPLFVIDKTPVGTDYSAVESMVDVNDIDKVTVLKDASATSEYGLQGANGVIVIKTKKN